MYRREKSLTPAILRSIKNDDVKQSAYSIPNHHPFRLKTATCANLKSATDFNRWTDTNPDMIAPLENQGFW